MPNIVEGSILIMSKAGAGTAMFSMGWYYTFINRFLFHFRYLHIFTSFYSTIFC